MTVADIAKAIEELKAEVRTVQSSASGEPAPEVRSIIDAFESIRTELQLDQPNLETLTGLLAEAKSLHEAIARQMIEEMRNGRVSTPFGTTKGTAKVKQVFDGLAAEILELARLRTAEFNELTRANTRATDDAQTATGEVNEQAAAYKTQEKAPTPAPQDWIDDIADTLTGATNRLNVVMNAHPTSKDDFLPILEQLLGLSLRAIAHRHQSGGGQPPRGPIDTASRRDDDDGMEPRILNLEKFAEESRKDLRSIDVRLTKVETVADGIAKNMATKTDLAQMEATLLKWFVGTAIALTGLAFTAAKLLH
jgi:hypothetical protein